MRNLFLMLVTVLLFSCRKESINQNPPSTPNNGYLSYKYDQVDVWIKSNYIYPASWIDKNEHISGKQPIQIKSWNATPKDTVTLHYSFLGYNPGEYEIYSSCSKLASDSTKYMKDTLLIWNQLIVKIGNDTVYNKKNIANGSPRNAFSHFFFNLY